MGRLWGPSPWDVLDWVTLGGVVPNAGRDIHSPIVTVVLTDCYSDSN